MTKEKIIEKLSEVTEFTHTSDEFWEDTFFQKSNHHLLVCVNKYMVQVLTTWAEFNMQYDQIKRLEVYRHHKRVDAIFYLKGGQNVEVRVNKEGKIEK